MAVEAKLGSFIKSIQGRLPSSHQAAYSLCRFIARGDDRVQTLDDSLAFTKKVLDTCRYLDQYDAKTAIPPHLYDLFAFLDDDAIIRQAGLVVDTCPNQLYEVDNQRNRIQPSSTEKAVAYWEGIHFFPYLLPKEVVHLIVLDVESR